MQKVQYLQVKIRIASTTRWLVARVEEGIIRQMTSGKKCGPFGATAIPSVGHLRKPSPKYEGSATPRCHSSREDRARTRNRLVSVLSGCIELSLVSKNGVLLGSDAMWEGIL